MDRSPIAERAPWLVRTPIAHRGSFDNPRIPENSLAAFRASIERGLPIELDIRLSADRIPMIFHDSDLSRLTASQAKVGDLTAAELSQLCLFDTEERIPRLAQALELVAGQTPLLIELKEHVMRASRIEKAVLEALACYPGAFALQSFHALSIGWLRRNAPGICCGQLASGPSGVPGIVATRPEFIAYCVDDLPHPDITRLRERGFPILAWTVRTPEQKAVALAHTDNYIFEDPAPFLPLPE